MATLPRPQAGILAPVWAARMPLRWSALSKVKGAAGAEQTEQADNDQIQSNDVVQQLRHHQDQDAGDQRHNRRETQIDMHGELPFTGSFSRQVIEIISRRFRAFYRCPTIAEFRPQATAK